MWTIREDAGWEGEAPRPISPECAPRLDSVGEGASSPEGGWAISRVPYGDDTESVVVYTWVYNSVHTGTQVCTRVYTPCPSGRRG